MYIIISKDLQLTKVYRVKLECTALIGTFISCTHVHTHTQEHTGIILKERAASLEDHKVVGNFRDNVSQTQTCSCTLEIDSGCENMHKSYKLNALCKKTKVSK